MVQVWRLIISEFRRSLGWRIVVSVRCAILEQQIIHTHTTVTTAKTSFFMCKDC